MMKRRDFLLTGGAALAGLGALGGTGDPNAPQTSPPAPPTATPTAPSAAGVVASPAGPVIPPPPSGATYVTRIEQARGQMRVGQSEALILPPGSDMRYLIGLRLPRSERLIALVVPLEGGPVLLGPRLERDRLTTSPCGDIEVVTWEEDEDPYEALVKILRKAGATHGRIAIGGTTWYDEFAHLNHLVPRLTFVTGTAVVGYLRERKSPEEVTLLRTAAQIVQRAIDGALKEVREGMREEDLATRVTTLIRESGASGEGLVQFGRRSAVPHNPTSDAQLAAGDVILVDFGAQVHGYWSDISRTAVFGTATGRMKLVHSQIRRAQDAALERAKPGVTCASLDQIARSTLGGRGFFKYILHRLGHGIGLDGHEPPWLTIGNSTMLEVGNVATLEPGVYTPDDYGIRIEDMMEVTPDGARLLSNPPETMLEI